MVCSPAIDKAAKLLRGFARNICKKKYIKGILTQIDLVVAPAIFNVYST